MDQDEYFIDLRTYIDNIDGDLKADTEEYERRLDICKECESLLSGMCQKCGCYVELRAVMKENYCPDIQNKWLV